MLVCADHAFAAAAYFSTELVAGANAESFYEDAEVRLSSDLICAGNESRHTLLLFVLVFDDTSQRDSGTRDREKEKMELLEFNCILSLL